MQLTQTQLRKIQLFWGFFIGIGAYAGAFNMISRPTNPWGGEGMVEMLPYLQQLPFAGIFFQDFLFPGIFLLIVNGLTNTFSIFLILRRSRYAALFGMICGIALVLWVSIQFCILPLHFLSVLYFIFGILQAINGWAYLKKTGFLSVK